MNDNPETVGLDVRFDEDPSRMTAVAVLLFDGEERARETIRKRDGTAFDGDDMLRMLRGDFDFVEEAGAPAGAGKEGAK